MRVQKVTNLQLFIAITRVENKIDLLTNKVVDVANRVIRIEDKLGIVPR